MATKITRDIIESYLNCKYKGHLKITGASGTPSDYEAMTTATRQVSRESALAKLVARFDEAEVYRGTTATFPILKQGVRLLVDAELQDDIMSLHLDALRRMDGSATRQCRSEGRLSLVTPEIRFVVQRVQIPPDQR